MIFLARGTAGKRTDVLNTESGIGWAGRRCAVSSAAKNGLAVRNPISNSPLRPSNTGQVST